MVLYSILKYFRKYTSLDNYDYEYDWSKTTSPENSSSLLNRLSFLWVDRVIKKGYKHPLQLNDLSDIPHELKVEYNQKFLKKLDFNNGLSYPLIYQCYKEFTLKNYLVTVIKLINILFIILNPILLKLLLNSIQEPNTTLNYKVFLAFMLFTSTLFASVTLQQGFWVAMKNAQQVKSCLLSKTYDKLFKINNSSKKLFNSGNFINLITVDIDNFVMYFWDYHVDIFMYPTQIIILLILIFNMIGMAGIFGFIVMVIVIPINTWFSSKSAKHYLDSLNYSDKRINLISEMINCIQFLKLYAWEKSFIDRIEDIRKNQLDLVKKMLIYGTLSTILNQSINIIVLLVSLTFYCWFGDGNVNITLVLTTLTIFNSLNRPLEMFPASLQSLFKLMRSSKRLEEFLELPEIEPSQLPVPIDLDTIDKDIIINNGNFNWDEQNENYTLKNVNIRAPYGKLTIICGPVGCGKTSLIHSILGEINKVSGYVQSFEIIGYASQQPFLKSTTIRDNILFGRDYHRERYIQVLEACALDIDISQFEDKDQTEIGERGINLSGGQKQRICLARALYCNPDCFILDDPLSAVDNKVSRHIFHKCINGKLMKDKTRILITHQIQYLSHADHIIIFNDQNEIIEQGKFKDLKNSSNFKQYLDLSNQINPEEKNGANHSTPSEIDLNQLIVDHDYYSIHNKLIVNEDRSEGNIDWNMTYLPLIKYGGSIKYFIVNLIFFIAAQILNISLGYFLANWGNNSTPENQSYYLWTYVKIVLCYLVFNFVSFAMLGKFSLNISTVLHKRLLEGICYAPSQFFLENPSGRILNRCSKDMVDIDIKMLPTISDVLLCYTNIIISMLSMVYFNPSILIPFFVMSFLYIFIQKIYRTCSIELKRMSNISFSPIYTLVQESFNGLTTIRSHQQSQRFSKEMAEKINTNVRLSYYLFAVHRWVGLRLEALACIIVLLASLTSIFQNGSPMSYLIITISLSITSKITWGVRQLADAELKMNSVERVIKYINIPREGSRLLQQVEPITLDSNWPHNGQIEFNNVSIKYKDTLDPVLSHISFKTTESERIGIVGRTGSGKSTLGLSLFRIVEAYKGEIKIDGIDISRISLSDLRSRLSVVPQDPYIFTGEVRWNLDPFNQYTDEEIWNCLEQVQLKKLVRDLPMALHSIIDQNCLSVGEKQLFCLCRALLKQSKIVLFDECSSSLDLASDSTIKAVIRSNFKHSTILTIAHRLDTIIDSDRILLLENGKLLNFDKPNLII